MDSSISFDATTESSGGGSPWKLRLFFSVDLIGSTAYKAYSKSARDDWEWCWTFEEFYSDFPVILKQASLEVEEWAACKGESNVTPWKFLGDEILFQLELSDYRETLFHLRSLQLALQKYNEKLRNKFRDSKGNVVLQCKGTAWLAGFPISNIEIKLPSSASAEGPIGELSGDVSEASEKYEDFIGSQMDCGFRLTKYASARKLVLSVDLVLMLATAMLDASGNFGSDVTGNMVIRFEGKESLKGVLAEKPYPVFWLDQKSKDQNHEDKWLGLGDDCQPGDVVTYCKDFLDVTEGIHKPFIDHDGGEKFLDKPDGFEERRKKAIDERNRLRRTMRPAEDESPLVEEPIIGPPTNELESPNCENKKPLD